MSATYGSRCIFVTVTVAGILAGCATTLPDEPTPPQLRVRGLTSPPEGTRDVVPARVDIRNGAGDTLYSGGAGNISAYLDLRKLDGPLVMTTTWTNGTTTTQTLNSPPGKPVEIVYDRLQQLPQQRYVLVAVAEPPADAGVGSGDKQQNYVQSPDYAGYVRAIELRAGYGKFNDKAPTYGVTTGADTPLKEAPSKVDYYSVELGVPFKGDLAGWRPRLEAKANFGSESTDSENSVGSRGEAFQGGFNGGTGGFASSAPSLSHVKTKYNEQSIAFVGQAPFGVFSQKEYSQIIKEFVLNFDRMARKYNGTLQYPAIPGLAADDDQKVRTYSIGAGVGAFGTHLFDNGVTATLGGRISANGIWGKYSGTHHYTSPLPGPNQDFIQTTSDNRCGFTWGGNAYGALGYRPNRNTEWGARVDYNHLGNGFALQNKVTPAYPTPYLFNSSLHSWRVSLGVRQEW